MSKSIVQRAVDTQTEELKKQLAEQADKYWQVIQEKSSKLAKMELERHDLREQLAAVTAERDALRDDKARLDWLDGVTNIIDKGRGDYRFIAEPGATRKKVDMAIIQDVANQRRRKGRQP